MPTTIDKFSDQMLARYFTSYFHAWDVFRATVNALERRKLDPGISIQERDDIEIELLWLHSEHARMIQRRSAFLRGALAVNRPSSEQFQQVQALAQHVENLTRTSTDLDDFIALATDAAELMADVHNEPAPRFPTRALA